MPNLTTTACIKRIAFISGSDVHQTIDDEWGHLQAGHVGKGEHPKRCHALYIALIDLVQGGVPIAANIAIVGSPIHFRCDLCEFTSFHFSQQVDAFIVTAQCSFNEAFGNDCALQRLPIGECCLQRILSESETTAPWTKRSNVSQQDRHFRFVDVDSGHAAVRKSGKNSGLHLCVIHAL